MTGPAVKPMTLRLPPDLASELEIVADVERRSIAEVVRIAVANYLTAQRRQNRSERHDDSLMIT